MSDQPQRVTGGCLCGHVRYEAEVYLQKGYVCHCTMCRRSTGQPAEIAVPIKAGTLRYTATEPRYYVSSEHGKRGFCEECGSRIVWQALRPEDDWLTNVDVGSLDDPANVGLSCHIFVDTQLPWFGFRDDLPKFEEDETDAMVEHLAKDRRVQP